MKNLLLLAIVLLMMGGCASMSGNVKQDIQPTRELRVIAYIDGLRTQGQVERLIERVNNRLEPEVGIRLKVVAIHKESFPMVGPAKLLDILDNKLEKDKKKYDLGILFTTYNIPEVLASQIFGCYEGATDTFWGRHIIVYTTSTSVLLHEIHHCFLYDDVVPGFGIRLMPFVPMLKMPVFLTASQKEKLLANKWRDFNVSPVVLAADKMPQRDWVQELFPHWKAKYPEQFGPGTEYDNNLKRNKR